MSLEKDVSGSLKGDTPLPAGKVEKRRDLNGDSSFSS